MAKAQKPAEKKAPAKKEAVKATKAESKPVAPAKKAEVKPRAPEPKAAEPKRAADAPAPERSLSDAVRAHPDAQLTKAQLQQLYQMLVDEKARVLSGHEKHVQEALADDDILADEIDLAQRSTDQAWLFRFADKERKLLIEIDAAIEKMRTGDYGICEGTDEAIGFKRLELRPWTRYSVAYKELLEREKAQQAR